MKQTILLRVLLMVAALGILLVVPAGSGRAQNSSGFTTYLPFAEKISPPFIAKNIIILLGDGMGPEQVKATGMYLYGAPGTLPFEAFPYKALMTTFSASSPVTDSAAGATAMATGHKVNNGVISLAIPGDAAHPEGSELYTLLEYAQDNGMSVGLVTSGILTDGTPAAFGAHEESRMNYSNIASDYLHQTRPNVLFGGVGKKYGLKVSDTQSAGYSVATDAAALAALTISHPDLASGQFDGLPWETDAMGNYPHLSDMAMSALDLLDDDPDGFFVMIESGKIDTAGYENNLTHMMGEMKEFASTAQKVEAWAQNHPSTVVIVLADHETGGLTVLQNNGQGNLPTVSWSTTEHTATNVPVYVYGEELPDFPTVLDNTQIPALLTGGNFNY